MSIPPHLDKTHWAYDAEAHTEAVIREALSHWPIVLTIGAVVVAGIALFMAVTP